MDKDSEIREAQTRVYDVFKKRPQKSYSTSKVTAFLEDGFTCKCSQGDNEAVMDMPKIMGGDDNGPTPGFFARAGIAGCVSMGIKQTAIQSNQTIESVTVDVETDFNDGAPYGLGNESAGPIETRLNILIKSQLSESEVTDLVEKALGLDPWFLALRDSQLVKVDLNVDD